MTGGHVHKRKLKKKKNKKTKKQTAKKKKKKKKMGGIGENETHGVGHKRGSTEKKNS